MSGDTNNRTRHICPDAQSGAAKGKESGLDTCRSSVRIVGRVRVSSSPDIGGRFNGKIGTNG